MMLLGGTEPLGGSVREPLAGPRSYFAPGGGRYRVGTTCRVFIDCSPSIGDQQEIVCTVKARSAGHSSRMRTTGVKARPGPTDQVRRSRSLMVSANHCEAGCGPGGSAR